MIESQVVELEGAADLDGPQYEFSRKTTSWWITAPMSVLLGASVCGVLRVTDSGGPMNIDLSGLGGGLLVMGIALVLAIQVAASRMQAWHYGAPGLAMALPWMVRFYQYPPVDDPMYFYFRYGSGFGNGLWAPGLEAHAFVLFFTTCFLAQALWIRRDGDRRHHWVVGLVFNTLMAAMLVLHMWVIFKAPTWLHTPALVKDVLGLGLVTALLLAVVAFQPFNKAMRGVARPLLIAAIVMVPVSIWLDTLSAVGVY